MRDEKTASILSGEAMRGNFLAFLITGLCFVGSAEAQTAATGNYTIAPGDRIEINILEDPTLNRQALVRPDGKISMPLAGTISVAGRSTESTQRVIRSRLAAQFVEPPTVTVSLVSVGFEDEIDLVQPTVYVLGEVRQPGAFNYDSERPLTVLQALSMAGGLDRFAARKRVQVRRYAGDGENLMIFDYDAVESGRSLAAPILIEDGDVIVVPERGLFN